MIKKLAWNTFKNTGNINTFLELVEVENTEKSLKSSNSSYITNKDINNSNTLNTSQSDLKND